MHLRWASCTGCKFPKIDNPVSLLADGMQALSRSMHEAYHIVYQLQRPFREPTAIYITFDNEASQMIEEENSVKPSATLSNGLF
jgi:hypothetical protein